MRRRSLAAWGALLPLAVIVLVGYVGTVLWTLRTSMSSSRTFPRDDFVGLQQFERLLDNDRWQHAIHNLAVYGVLYIVAAMLIGFLLAVFIDQKVRGEGALRTAFLYPYAMSFVATGLVWQWVLNPDSGLQNAMHKLDVSTKHQASSSTGSSTRTWSSTRSSSPAPGKAQGLSWR